MKKTYYVPALLVITLGSIQAWADCNEAMYQSTPTSQFTDNGDGTVTDDDTQLMWMRCSSGQEWSSDTEMCLDSDPDIMTTFWPGALEFARDSEFAGHDDWRLPNIKELASIVERACDTPAVNETIFPNTPTDSYTWSASPYANDVTHAWIIDFNRGNRAEMVTLTPEEHTSNMDNSHYVRLVRTVQY